MNSQTYTKEVVGKVSTKQDIVGKIQGSLNSPNTINGNIGVGIVNIGSSDSVFQFDTKFSFPTIGKLKALYISQEENAAYRWNDEDLHYYCVGRDYLEIKLINGGNSQNG